MARSQTETITIRLTPAEKFALEGEMYEKVKKKRCRYYRENF